MYIEELECEVEELRAEIERLEGCEEELKYYKENIQKLENIGFSFEEAIGFLLIMHEIGFTKNFLQRILKLDNALFKKILSKAFYHGSAIEYVKEVRKCKI